MFNLYHNAIKDQCDHWKYYNLVNVIELTKTNQSIASDKSNFIDFEVCISVIVFSSSLSLSDYIHLNSDDVSYY